ncbi:MAG: hypothetical protein QXP98_09580 [Thermoproteus sp.]
MHRILRMISNTSPGGVHRETSMRFDIILAAVVAAAIMIAILSMPKVLEPIARVLLSSLSYILPIALLAIGVVHGLKPDEHTWPITISYAMMQKDAKRAVLTTMTFTGALTLVWTAMSALVGLLPSSLFEGVYDWLVDVLVGLTMVTIAGLYLRKEHEGDSGGAAPDYKAIWIHGVGAAFGGDFFVVLLLALSIKAISQTFPLALVGFLFGFGSFLGQLGIVLLAYKGLVRLVKAPQVLVRAGRLSLLILGFFLIGLGIYTFIFPSS